MKNIHQLSLLALCLGGASITHATPSNFFNNADCYEITLMASMLVQDEMTYSQKGATEIEQCGTTTISFTQKDIFEILDLPANSRLWYYTPSPSKPGETWITDANGDSLLEVSDLIAIERITYDDVDVCQYKGTRKYNPKLHYDQDAITQKNTTLTQCDINLPAENGGLMLTYIGLLKGNFTYKETNKGSNLNYSATASMIGGGEIMIDNSGYHNAIIQGGKITVKQRESIKYNNSNSGGSWSGDVGIITDPNDHWPPPPVPDN